MMSSVYRATRKEHVTAGILHHYTTISFCLRDANDRMSLLSWSSSKFTTPVNSWGWVSFVSRGTCRAFRGVWQFWYFAVEFIRVKSMAFLMVPALTSPWRMAVVAHFFAFAYRCATVTTCYNIGCDFWVLDFHALSNRGQYAKIICISLRRAKREHKVIYLQAPVSLMAYIINDW